MLKQRFHQANEALRGGGWLAAAASGFFLASCAAVLQGMVAGLPFDKLAFVVHLNWWVFFGVLVTSTAALVWLCLRWGNQRPLSTVLPAACFGFVLLLASGVSGGSIYFSLGLCLPLYFTLRWSFSQARFPFGKPGIPMRATLAVAAALFLGFTLLLSYASILRYRTYNATNFDLGLFAQMFESLRKTGHAFTTLERNEFMTHFGVHCSPIFYLLLPIYMLAPRVETLLVMQAAAVGAGVFAVRGIARRLFGKSPRLIMLSCLLFVLNPGFSLGLLYDFHENKFLTALVLFAVYFLLKEKVAGLLVFSALILSVKEDAAIYVVSLALFLLIAQRWTNNRRRAAAGIIMIAASVI